MKTNLYNSLVSRSNSVNASSVSLSKSKVNKEIQSRHALWQSDNKDSRRDFTRVYRDWYQVYRMRKPAQRMVVQSQVDTIDKMEVYLAPLFFGDSYCTITTADRSADALRSKVSAKTGRIHYIAPIRWTVSALETAVKYCAKYYAGTETDIESKFNAIQ
jgi:hypothetical protein